MRKMWLTLALVLGLLAMTACSGESGNDAEKTAGEAQSSAAKNAPAASGSIPFMGRAELDQYLKDNGERPTMLFFWATWCPSCKQQIPELEALRKVRGDQVNIIALSVDERVEALERYLEKNPMDVSVYLGDQELARDFRVEAIPTLVIFDKTGKHIFSQAGVFPGSMLGAMVDKLN
ncbi:TlpA family protein disulfide reductase [Desulfovibrio sp. Fe33]|uniref:TlpA family protein disulfide reductase n=1 Tax=Desulfovibrio sp. Fe33 TaxID=3020842 RepID=UPI00234E334A|nr:TlpA disulfide reductase family protein [Desulfovibrio sp. Fe33]